MTMALDPTILSELESLTARATSATSARARAVALLDLADSRLRCGDFVEARRVVVEALEPAITADGATLAARCRLLRAECESRERGPQAAEVYFSKALGPALSSGDPSLDTLARLVGARISLAFGQPGDAARAEKALIGAEEGEAHFYLARIYLGRSLLSFLSDGANSSFEDHRALSHEWIQRALEHVDLLAAWEAAEPIDRHVAQAYRALVQGRAEELLVLCDEGLRRFAKEMGAEEYWNLRGWVKDGVEAIEAYAKAIELSPAWGVPY